MQMKMGLGSKVGSGSNVAGTHSADGEDIDMDMDLPTQKMKIPVWSAR